MTGKVALLAVLAQLLISTLSSVQAEETVPFVVPSSFRGVGSMTTIGNNIFGVGGSGYSENEFVVSLNGGGDFVKANKDHLVCSLVTPTPTATPTAEPTANPSVEPTAVPTVRPTASPSAVPSVSPSLAPSTVSPTPMGSFRYWRIEITQIREADDRNLVSFNDWSWYATSVLVKNPANSASYSLSNFAPGQPENAIITGFDSYRYSDFGFHLVGDKYYDNNGYMMSPYPAVIVDFGRAMFINGYQWRTSNSPAASDPVGWIISASTDGVNWLTQHTVTGYNPPLNRQSSTIKWVFTPDFFPTALPSAPPTRYPTSLAPSLTPTWMPSALPSTSYPTVHGTYRYWKIEWTKVRWHNWENLIQFTDWFFCNNGYPVPQPTTPSSYSFYLFNDKFAGVHNIIGGFDNNVNTRFYYGFSVDYYIDSNGFILTPSPYVTIDFGTNPPYINSYRWSTYMQKAELDPAGWNILSSTDNVNWVLQHSVVDYWAPPPRMTLTTTWNMTVV